MGTPAKYYEAYKVAYSRLISALPINDMLSELVTGGVLPGKVKARMDAISTDNDKAKYMLDEMEGGLKVLIPDQFENLIKVMEKFSEEEGHIVVKKLAEDIRVMVTSGGTPSSSLLTMPGLTSSSSTLQVLEYQSAPVQIQQTVNTAETPMPDLHNRTVNIQWSQGAPLPVASEDHKAVVYNGAIYVGGGSDKDGPLFRVDVYHPDTDQWGNTIESPHKLFGLTVLMDKLLMVGGRPRTGSVINEVLYLDRDQWHRYTEMPTARSGCSAVSRQSMMIVIGGWNGERGVSAVEVYDNTTGQWFKYDDLPIPLYYLEAKIVGDMLFAINGIKAGNQCTRAVYYSQLQSTSSGQLRWQALADTPCAAMSAVGVGNKYLLVVGGRSRANTVHVQKNNGSDLSSMTWKNIGSIPDVHYYASAVCIGNKIFIIGGKDYEAEIHDGMSIGTFL